MQIESTFDNNIPWVEKYRPKKLDQLLSHHSIVKILMQYIANNNFPNLLMYGSPGTGKTSTIISCAK